MTETKEKKPTGLQKVRINFGPVGDMTLREVYGESCTIPELAKKIWALIREKGLNKPV